MLKKIGLLRDTNYYPQYPENPASHFKQFSYIETWRELYSKAYYHFMLEDYSLLHFRVEGGDEQHLSFSFMECPYTTLPYELFLEELGFSLDEVGDSFLEEYELEASNFASKDDVMPIRYDYEPELYQSGLHPASHIHFGYESDIRIGTKRILRPMSFTLFVVRQCYKSRWPSVIKHEKADNWCRNVRQSLEHVDDRFFNEIDHLEMHLD